MRAEPASSAAPSEDAGTAPAGPGSTATARNAAYLGLGQLVTTALAVVFNAALGRRLGADDFGLYFLITTMVGFAYVSVDWGPLVIADTAREPARAGEFLGSALALRLAVSAVVLVPLVLVALALGYPARTCWLLVAFFAATLPLMLAQVYGLVFRGHDRMDRDALVSILNRAFGLVFVLAVLFLGGRLPWVAASTCAAGVVAVIAARLFHRQLRLPKLAYSRPTALHLLVAGSPIIAAGAMTNVHGYLDAVFLSKLVPAEAIGWYGAARNIIGTLGAPALILGQAAYPQLSRTALDRRRFREEVRNALRPMLLIAGLGAAGTYLFADTAVYLIYGKVHYGPSVLILEAFAPGMFLLFVDILLANALLAANRSKELAIVKLVSLVVASLLDLVLIPWFQLHHHNGGIGVVVSFALSEFVVFAGALLTLPRGTLSAKYALDGGKTLLATAGTILLMTLLHGLPFVIGIPVAVAAFALIAYALRLLVRSDLALLGAWRRRGPHPNPG